MSEVATGKYPATLAEALAVFQANAPKVGKGNTAEVKNDQGKKLYEYSYADLADVNAVVLPCLGAVGLAFTSRPTMLDGQFVLAYSLVHVSGEREDGIYPLQANLAPQKVGGLITYARRYSLLAVTGVAAAGDDDDAGAAEAEHRQSAADAFENARPAPVRPVNQGPDREVTARPRVTRPEAAETDSVWLDLMGQEIAQIKTREDGTKAWASIAAAFRDNTCNAADRKALEGLVAGKVSEVVDTERGAA